MLQRVDLMAGGRMAEVCQECGCSCNRCLNSNSLDLHHEIEELRSHLTKSNSQMGQMEKEFMQSKDFADQEIARLQDELAKLRDRYDRLMESHKKMQRLNHNLEDKLLSVVNKCEGDKSFLHSDISVLNSKLVDAKVTICELEEECERYRQDCNMAASLLQCKPSNFVQHKLAALPLDLQQRVKSHMNKQQMIDLDYPAEAPTRTIRVPMPTFPPTAMVYSVNKPAEDESGRKEGETVPTTLIARVLTQPEPQRRPRRIYICDQCKGDHMFRDQEIQTTMTLGGQEVNGYQRPTPPGASRTNQPYNPHPGVHRSRLNSTETEI